MFAEIICPLFKGHGPFMLILLLVVAAIPNKFQLIITIFIAINGSQVLIKAMKGFEVMRFKNFDLQKEIVAYILKVTAPRYYSNKKITSISLKDFSWIENSNIQISASTDGESFAKWADIQQTKVARFSSNGKEFNLADFKPYLKEKNQMN